MAGSGGRGFPAAGPRGRGVVGAAIALLFDVGTVGLASLAWSMACARCGLAAPLPRTPGLTAGQGGLRAAAGLLRGRRAPARAPARPRALGRGMGVLFTAYKCGPRQAPRVDEVCVQSCSRFVLFIRWRRAAGPLISAAFATCLVPGGARAGGRRRALAPAAYAQRARVTLQRMPHAPDAGRPTRALPLPPAAASWAAGLRARQQPRARERSRRALNRSGRRRGRRGSSCRSSCCGRARPGCREGLDHQQLRQRGRRAQGRCEDQGVEASTGRRGSRPWQGRSVGASVWRPRAAAPAARALLPRLQRAPAVGARRRRAARAARPGPEAHAPERLWRAEPGAAGMQGAGAVGAVRRGRGAAAFRPPTRRPSGLRARGRAQLSSGRGRSGPRSPAARPSPRSPAHTRPPRRPGGSWRRSCRCTRPPGSRPRPTRRRMRAWMPPSFSVDHEFERTYGTDCDCGGSGAGP
jgi:hypothetical protein